MSRRLRALCVALAVAVLTTAATTAPARALTESEKIDPSLRALMEARPLALLPVIVEMQHPTAPSGAPNADRAAEALDLLRVHGVPVGGLALINSAAGFANAAGVAALSLVPSVAYIHHDATVSAGVVTRGDAGRVAIDPLPTPSPLPTPTIAPTSSPEPMPTPAPTPAPTTEPAPSPAPTPAPTTEPAPSPAPTPAPMPAPTEPPSPTPAPSESAAPTAAPAPSASPAPTPAPSEPAEPSAPSPTPAPTAAPPPTTAPATPTPTPSDAPAATPQPSATPAPDPAPTAAPASTEGPAASPSPTPTTQAAAPYPRVVNADAVWLKGRTGRGVTIAVLDSGVAPDPDLVEPTNRIVATVNFSDSRSVRDPGGHGTHVAGIAAGNGTRSSGEFVGIAPQANIVDVRVLDSRGSGRLSSVIRGIEWVLAHRDAYNIRVINLSLGAPVQTSYRTDPLAAAVEIAWQYGLVVVAASGNSGPDPNTVHSPGHDPYIITVGASDDRGTVDRGDDALAPFSSWGSADSHAKPDLVAPGRRIVSIRAPGSALETALPDRVVTAQNGSTYLRLSGTSMATPVVSGIVALMLEARPDLKPDQVKGILLQTAQPYGGASGVAPADPIADGAGLVDALAAANAAPSATETVSAPPTPPVANKGLRPANTFARAVFAVLYSQPTQWITSTLTSTVASTSTWESVAWDSVAWDSVAWDSVAWDSIAWDSVAWDSVAWDSVAWDSVAWDSVAWDSVAWDSSSRD